MSKELEKVKIGRRNLLGGVGLLIAKQAGLIPELPEFSSVPNALPETNDLAVASSNKEIKSIVNDAYISNAYLPEHIGNFHAAFSLNSDMAYINAADVYTQASARINALTTPIIEDLAKIYKLKGVLYTGEPVKDNEIAETIKQIITLKKHFLYLNFSVWQIYIPITIHDSKRAMKNFTIVVNVMKPSFIFKISPIIFVC